jgi:hypothetical protein
MTSAENAEFSQNDRGGTCKRAHQGLEVVHWLLAEMTNDDWSYEETDDPLYARAKPVA